MPTTEDMNKAREQTAQAFGGAVEQARTPLLAALGAGDLAAKTILETLTKVREQADAARAEFSGDPAELRQRVDAYAQSAAQFYGYLAVRGEEALGRLRSQPPVKTARERAENVAEDARDLADDVLGKTGRSTSKPDPARAKATSTAKAPRGSKGGKQTKPENP